MIGILECLGSSLLTKMAKSAVDQTVGGWLQGILEKKELTLQFHDALEEAYVEFKKSHSQLAESFFDEHFLVDQASDELQLFFSAADRPEPKRLARLYQAQFFRSTTDVTLAAAEFITILENSLRSRPVFRELIESRQVAETHSTIHEVMLSGIEELKHALGKALALLPATRTTFGLDKLEPWTPKGVRFGLKFEVLRQTSTGFEFTRKFVDAMGSRAIEQPPQDYPAFRNNVLLAVLDTTPIKIFEEDLTEFGDAAMLHLIEFLAEIAIRAHIISLQDGGIVLNKAMKLEAIDHFAAEFQNQFEDFQHEALVLFRDMTRARLVLYEPGYADLWSMVAYLALILFDGGQLLQALWEGALKPGAMDPD